MTVELVTGRAGTPHISSGDDRAYHAYTAGAGRYVLHGGGAEVESANNVHLDPAEILVDGAFVRITGSGEDVALDNGASSYDRVDVIALHYTREGDGDEAVESMVLSVVKGTPVDTGGDAQAPSMPASGSILDGVTETYVPYYSVKIVGLTPQTPELVMEEYVGLPGLLEALAGGTTGQILRKTSGADYDAEWTDAGVPVGGTTGQILRKASGADYDTEWLSVLPLANGGTGLTGNPSMLVNLASTAADSVLKSGPRPGVTGTLPVARGGTGLTSLNVQQVNSASSGGLTARLFVYMGHVCVLQVTGEYSDDVDSKITTFFTIASGYRPKNLTGDKLSMLCNDVEGGGRNYIQVTSGGQARVVCSNGYAWAGNSVDGTLVWLV